MGVVSVAQIASASSPMDWFSLLLNDLSGFLVLGIICVIIAVATWVRGDDD
jgi:hypothetical protein